MSEDSCEYWVNNKRCGHTLGPWAPDPLKVENCTDIMSRTCEKCGGEQMQFRSSDPETNKAIDEIFAHTLEKK